MRPFVFAALLAVALLLALPAVDASCHYCFAPDPIPDYLRRVLP